MRLGRASREPIDSVLYVRIGGRYVQVATGTVSQMHRAKREREARGQKCLVTRL